MEDMLDPDWTPECGYSHAHDLLAILAKHDAEQEERERENDVTERT